jgi:hypothetical protein
MNINKKTNSLMSNRKQEGNILKHKKHKTLMTMLCILVFILLSAGIFFGTYYLIMNKSSDSYEKDVKVIVDKINEVNSSVSLLFKGQAIDPIKTRMDMSGKVDTLSKRKAELEGLTVTDKYKKDHDNLLNGLNKNILIFRQIDAIVKNPNGSDINKAGEDLGKYRDEALESYSLVNIKNLKIGLTDNGLKFVEYATNYVNEMVKLNRDKEINQNQNLEFINNLDTLISRFSSINSDLAVQMANIRNEKGNMDNVIALADKNRDDLALIHQEFSTLTVPSKAVNTYKLFKNILEDFDSYFQSFVYSANNEKLSGSDLEDQKINEIYSEPTAKFNEITKAYNNFLKSYSEFRESSIK